jgi:UDP-glucose 4-epimerase
MILGAAGFIGTNLFLSLLRNGYANDENEITLVDTCKEFFRPIEKFRSNHIKLIENSLNDSTDFLKLLDHQDLVYHLVSTTVPATSNSMIPQEIEANVIFTAKMLDACVRCKVQKVVFVSSGGTVYGKETDCPLREETPTYPISSYGIQKITIEKLLYLYNYLYGLDYRVVRFSNPYGPFQRPNGVLGVVTTFTYKALNRQTINIYGDGSTVRDFIYIDDAVAAMQKVVFGNQYYRTFNIGSGVGTSIKSIVAEIDNVLDVELKINYLPSRKADLPVNYLDISRYEKAYGKLIHIDLQHGIRMTADFIENHKDLYGEY